MATEFVSFLLPNYLPDWSPTPRAIAGRFSRPPGMADAAVANILAAIGATAKTPNTQPPCPVPNAFDPRRLKFRFASGGSLSLPFADRAQAVATASQLADTLGSALQTTISCIELIGEEWSRMDEELAPTTGPARIPTPGIDTRATTGSKNLMYSTNINYQLDNSTSFTVQNVRMNSDTVTAPFSAYAASIPVALGTPLPSGCGSNSFITPRRYSIKILTTNVRNPVRSMIVPVASAVQTNIRNAGDLLLNNLQTLCLKYNGESDPRFGRFLTPPIG